MPGDRTTFRNGDLGNFILREQYRGGGTEEREIRIPHTQGHFDYLHLTSEEGTWTSPRPRRLCATQRTPSPLTLMPVSDDEEEVPEAEKEEEEEEE